MKKTSVNSRLALINILFFTAVVLPVWGQDILPVRSGRMSPDAPVVKPHAVLRAEGAVNNLFTADVVAAHSPIWRESFDTGMSEWTVSSGTSAVEWTSKATTGDKAFSAIDPSDRQSLYVSGPYQTFKREISSLTSSKFTVTSGCSLDCWVGFSRNYDTYCRLIISVSDDDFATSTELWNSKDATGDTGWRWHSASAALDDWSGRTVSLRLTYSWGSDDMFQTGGYMGDFYVDNLTLTGFSPVDKVNVSTGEKVTFVPLVEAESYSWQFGENAVPATSREARPVVYYTAPGSYDVSLEAVVSGSPVNHTQADMVVVEGEAPQARIGMPASFRFADNRRYMVAPLVSVDFTDESEGFPTSWKWSFTGVTDGDGESVYNTSEQNPSVNYMYRHNWDVALEVSNSKGVSSVSEPVAVEYEGVVCNWHPSDYITHFDMDDWGHFPGSTAPKVGMTQYAERFSAPSRPVTVDGVYLYFTTVDLDEDDVTAQIQNLGVHLCKSVNGEPGERLESWWWQCNELDYTPGGTTACWFPFTYTYTDDDGTTKTYMPPVVDDEFFVVVGGFPERTEKTQVTLGMAAWRGDGNTAYLFKDGKWQSADSYFGENRQTSLAVMPYVSHSVMTLLPVGVDEVAFSREGGERTVDFFSYLGWKKEVGCDADWCRVTNDPGEYTLDKLVVECDPLVGDVGREAHITITDRYGADSHVVTVTQAATSSVNTVDADLGTLSVTASGEGTMTVAYPLGTKTLTLTDVAGRVLITVSPAPGSTSTVLDVAGLARGIYIVFSPSSSVKVAL